MYYINKFNHIHFIGILGSSMSGLAIIAKDSGAIVSGSDRAYNHRYEYLTQKGIQVYIGSNVNVVRDCDLVVYTSAVSIDDIELKYARLNGIICIERAEFLGILARDYKYTIAVSGTHGKTTVTGMIGEVFSKCGVNPTIHLGGELVSQCVGGVKGDNNVFVTEACEYRESFRTIFPNIAVVLNIERDHPDYYRNLDEIKGAFKRFCYNASDNGAVVTCCEIDVPNDVNKITIGRDYIATDITENNGLYSFVPVHNGDKGTLISLRIFGAHNVNNALVTYAVALEYGLRESDVANAISEYKGVKRRFEVVGNINGATMISDYAHHPTELKAVIDTATKVAKGKVIALFQPHTYSRTAKLFDEFCSCFDGVDSLIIVKEYSAREVPNQGKSAYQLYESLKGRNYTCEYCEIDNCLYKIKNIARPYDIVLLLGAGDMPEKVIDNM